MVAAAGAGVAAVEHELLGRQARLARGLVEELGLLDELAPARRRMDVDLDHARVGRHAQDVEARVARRLVAFEHDRQAQSRAPSSSTAADELEVVLERRRRRHEDVQAPLSRGSALIAVRTTNRAPTRTAPALRPARLVRRADRSTSCVRGRRAVLARTRMARVSRRCVPARPCRARRRRHASASGGSCVVASGGSDPRQVGSARPGQRVERQAKADAASRRGSGTAVVAQEPGPLELRRVRAGARRRAIGSA